MKYRAITLNLIGILAVQMLMGTFAAAEVFLDKSFSVEVTSAIEYDPVNHLLLDLYKPVGENVPIVKPALVCVHGGAWVSGSRDHPPTNGTGGPGDTYSPAHEYAMEFAKRGYVCVSIDYRLYNHPGVAETGLLDGLNLQPITDALNTLFGTSEPVSFVKPIIESSVEDLVHAVDWIVNHATMMGVDVNRIAVGGFSAGAFNSLFAGFLANNGKIAIAWANSGSLGGGGNEALILSATTSPIPVIIFYGMLDLIVPYATFAEPLKAALIAENIPHAFYTLPNENHTYPMSTLLTDPPEKGVPDTLENVLSEFMYTHLSLNNIQPPVIPTGHVPTVNAAGLAVLAVLLAAVATVFLLRRRTAAR
ncbi:MAG TPA: alpha/beta hydrolase [Candidatus Hydrogenedentes bacterium]|nr:alpha/beta hydrolase [Candidatus Hydrogenedentota bacterium]